MLRIRVEDIRPGHTIRGPHGQPGVVELVELPDEDGTVCVRVRVDKPGQVEPVPRAWGYPENGYAELYSVSMEVAS